jgi:predicted DNA-binding transcriptional regulator AlpA
VTKGAEDRSLSDIICWLAEAPTGTLIPADALAAMLRARSKDDEHAAASPAPAATASPSSWRERLWTVAPDTRLGVQEVAEAAGRSRDWVYRHTGPSGSGIRLPHRKLDGELVFVAGEVRNWLTAAEQVIEPGHRHPLRLARS